MVCIVLVVLVLVLVRVGTCVDVDVRMCTVCVRGKRMPRSPKATFLSGVDRHQGPAVQRPIPNF